MDWNIGLFPDMVLKMYVKPIVKQRFAVAFSPCAKTLISLGKISVSKEWETWSRNPYKTWHILCFWSTFGEKLRKSMENHYVHNVLATYFYIGRKPYKTNGKPWFLKCRFCRKVGFLVATISSLSWNSLSAEMKIPANVMKSIPKTITIVSKSWWEFLEIDGNSCK